MSARVCDSVESASNFKSAMRIARASDGAGVASG